MAGAGKTILKFITGLPGLLCLLVIGLMSALTFVLAGHSAYVASRSEAQITYNTAVDDADFIARNVEALLRNSDLDTISQSLSIIRYRDNIETIQVIDSGLNFMIDGTDQETFRFEGAPGEEVRSILKGANRTIVSGPGELRVYEPLVWNGDTVGVLSMTVHQADVWTLAAHHLWQNFIGGMPMMAAAFVLVMLLSVHLTRPLRALSATAERIAAGEKDLDVPVRGTHETRYLGQAMRQMIADLTAGASRARELAAEAHEAAQKAKDASRAKSNFLANMSHEIRTPMNGVIGITEILLKTEMDPKQRELANIILSSGTSLVTIINDILDFSKIEAGKLKLVEEPFNLRTAIEDVLSLMSGRAREKDIEIMVDFDQTLPEGYIGDAGRMRQIITNLAGNAVKFTERGHVAVRVKGHEAEGCARLVIEVEDTGIGIDESKVLAIFDQFEQVDSTSTRKYQGTGLGLAITRHLVDMMGGDIAVDSEPGRGSTFRTTVTLPVDESVTAGRYAEAPAVAGLSVLIVDDNQHNRRILIDQISDWGMEVVAVDSAEAALAELDGARAFDLIVTDYHMPEQDGVMFARMAKQAPRNFAGPVIMLSSISERSEAPEDALALFDIWLTKPVRASRLLDAISTSMYNRQIVKLRDVARKMASDGPPAAPSAPIDVLVAEDNVVNQMVIKTMLEGMNARVRLAENGQQAVDMFAEKKPAIVIMDVSMPGMDGIEATRLIRTREMTNGMTRTPIIAATAHVLEEDRRRCIDAGMDDVVTKPVQQKKLVSTIERWLDGQAGIAVMAEKSA